MTDILKPDMHRDWWKEFPGGITICDTSGVILWMNDQSARIFGADGGYSLIGKNLLDCHPEPARNLVRELLESGERNVYTIEKKGIRKLIYQSPLYQYGKYSGFVELSLEIPEILPHFVRS